MSNILLHLSTKDKIYAGICSSILKNSNQNIYSADLHNNLLDTAQECSSDVVVLPSYEYTKEFYTFVTTTVKKVILIISENMPKQFIDILLQTTSNKKNIFLIHKEKISDNCITHDQLYDNNVFYNQENKNRLQKIAILLHDNNDINKKLLPVLYPNSKNIVCFNNQKFNHPTNLGGISLTEFAKILNEYEHVLDLTNLFTLESMACGCLYIDNNNDYLIENITNKKILPIIPNLKEKTFEQFVLKNDKLLSILGG